MPSVEEITEQIIAREGGYVNDPADPGGPTKYGVALATLAAWRRAQGIAGGVTAADVQALTVAEAARIFRKDYYDRPGIARLPEPLRASVYDMYVNAGRNAVVILQELLNRMGEALQADGVIGPITEAAAARAAAAAPGFIADAYAIARRNWYYALADRTPALRKFARRRDGGKGGWITRAEGFMSEHYRLSPAEHAQRVASWA